MRFGGARKSVKADQPWLYLWRERNRRIGQPGVPGGVAYGLVGLSMLASACSSLDFLSSASDEAFLDAGAELIENELADQIGLGPLTATCTGQNLSAGDTFECSASAGQLTPILFTGTINDDEETVVITSTNLLLSTQVQQVEAFAAGLLSEQTTRSVNPEDFDCGDTSVVITGGEVLSCIVTDPSDGTKYDAPVTIENLEDLSITVNIGNPIG